MKHFTQGKFIAEVLGFKIHKLPYQPLNSRENVISGLLLQTISFDTFIIITRDSRNSKTIMEQMKMNTYLAHIKTVRYQIKVSETITSISISNIDNGFVLYLFCPSGQ